MNCDMAAEEAAAATLFIPMHLFEMKVNVDFSIFIEDGSVFGRVSGEIELAQIPTPGATISLQFPTHRTHNMQHAGTVGLLRVTEVVFSPEPCLGPSVLLTLQDLCVPAREVAAECVKYLEEGFSLGADLY